MSHMEGGAYGGIDELYREVILEHFKAPKNKGAIPHPTTKADGMNPLCGDQITISATVEGEIIKDLKFEGQGCAISQSSASMMTAAIKGKSLGEAKSLTRGFKSIFGVVDPSSTGAPAKPDELGDLEALEGVKKYPVRIKCALLAWNTLLEALGNLKQ
jgi:nitrogen fixation NifU-like protein